MPRKKTIKEMIDDVKKAHDIYETPKRGMSVKRYMKLSKKHGWTSISTLNRYFGGLTAVKNIIGINVRQRAKRLSDMTDREYMCANCPVGFRVQCENSQERIEKCHKIAKDSGYFEGRDNNECD